MGIAKGAGMIEPNMATMLVYLLTDLQVPLVLAYRPLILQNLCFDFFCYFCCFLLDFFFFMVWDF